VSRNRDLALVSVAAIVCALVAGFVPVAAIRTVAAVPLALVLPGYAITAAAFARSRPGGPQRLVLAFGTSLLVLPLGALPLNIIPSGLTTAAWAIFLVFVVLYACAVAAVLRPSAPPAAPRRRPRPRPRDAILLGLAGLIAAGAIVLAETPLPAKHADGYAALWMVPSGAGGSAVEVGVLSNQQEATDYTLQVSQDGGSTTSRRLQLAPGQQEAFVVAVARAAGGRSHVTAKLFRSAKPNDVYRQVNLWLPRRGTFP
jgi:hypothetical protein